MVKELLTMDRILIDFSKESGKVKPMHSVNNGPVYKFSADQRFTNIEHIKTIFSIENPLQIWYNIGI